MIFKLLCLLQKDAVEAERWVARVRRREWREEWYQEKERVRLEALERKEEEGDALRGEEQCDHRGSQ